MGAVALVRARRCAGRGRTGATVALALGPLCMVGGIINWALADGGLGTGNGVVAGGMSLALGLTATVLGGLALARTRRSTEAPTH
ncbi:DUF6223 family protein [Propionibacteriaceae bacterium Y2011]